MAVDFVQDTVTYKAKREYTPIQTINQFLVLRQSWQQDSSMGMTNKDEVTGMSFTGVKEIKNGDGELVVTYKVQSALPGIYPDLMTGINSAFAEETFTDGYYAEEDVSKRNWKMTLHGMLNGSEVSLALDESYAILTYHTADQLTAVEAWADARTELSS